MALRDYRFPKNERGWNVASHQFLRNTIIRYSSYYHNPIIVNREYMPLTGPCFIFGNHSNNNDPFVINTELVNEPTAGVMARDQFHRFLPALFMDSIGIVPTSKYVPEPGVIRNVYRMVDQQRMIVIFPEGGRRWDGRPKGLIDSTMKLFWKVGIPVHPVQLHGSYVGWPRWADHIRRNRYKMVFLKPLVPSEFPNYEAFHAACVEAMDFHEEEPPQECTPFAYRNLASGIDRILYRCPVTGEAGGIFTPDGTRVKSHFAPEFQFIMNPNSQLVDAEGRAWNVSRFYDQIRALPLQTDANGLLLDDARCFISRIDRNVDLVPIGEGRCWLHPDHVGLQYDGVLKRIPLESLLYVSIEQNSRITLTFTGETWQFALRQTKALEWQDTLRRLQREA